jgi:exoribonuclease R
VDTLVSELMILVNSTWGRLLADRGYDAIYRNQKGGKTRMEVVPGAHEWLGVSHYAWTSSPLRRYCDLANQRQLVAAVRAAEPAYTRDELVAAARDFDTAYEAYAEHQRALERYWCLRYLQQEGIAEIEGRDHPRRPGAPGRHAAGVARHRAARGGARRAGAPRLRRGRSLGSPRPGALCGEISRYIPAHVAT